MICQHKSSINLFGTIFCDWHLEMIKPILFEKVDNLSQAMVMETKETAMWILNQLLHLLHPFMPFVTQHLYNKLINSDEWLMSNAWPQYSLDFTNASNEIEQVTSLITMIRSLRSQVNIAPSESIEMVVIQSQSNSLEVITNYNQIIANMAKLKPIELQSTTDSQEDGMLRFVWQESLLALRVGDFIDIDQERLRLQKSLQDQELTIVKLSKKLNNQDFVQKAPEEVLSQVKNRLNQAEQTRDQLKIILKSL